MDNSKQSPNNDYFSKSSLIKRMEGGITVCGVKTTGLIDSDSIISSVLESFYASLPSKPALHNITEFG